MNRYKKLFNNSILFAIGNLGSKLITVIMVPFDTYILSTKQFGDVDLITATVNMLAPIISLSIFDAVLRFVMDKSEDKNSVLSNAIWVTLVGSIIFSIILIPIFHLIKFKYTNYLILILITQVFQSIFSEYARAVDRVKLFAATGILGTFVTAISNIVLMFTWKLGLDGYLVSIFVSSVVCIIFLIIKLKVWNIFDFHLISKKQMKRMLVYSIPLIPNAFAWWATNTSNRYFIVFFIGISANGLFAVANKVPSLLNMVNSIFFQSWQMSAIEEFESDSKEEYYSNIFLAYLQLLFICSLGIIAILKIFMKFFVSASYYSSWKLVPFLLISVIYSSLSSFLGTNYIAAKQTAGVMSTTIIGAILNVVFCLILIPVVGVNGAGIASAISFLIICILRLKDTRKFIHMKMPYKEIILDHIFFIIQYMVLFIPVKLFVVEMLELSLFAIFVIINRKNIMRMVRKFI